jgi:uncharacterized membrane protein (DUF485 family)
VAWRPPAAEEREPANRRTDRVHVAGTAFYCGYLLAFLCLLGFAPDTMSKRVVGSVTLALVLGMSLIVLAFVMALLHARRADEWDRMAQRVVATLEPDEPRFTKQRATEGSVQ